MPTLSFTGSYSQTFDSLASAGTGVAWTNGTTLDGWYLFRQPAPGTPITAYNANDGGSNAGSFFSYGTTATADRALGGLGSGGNYFGSPATGSVAGWIGFGAVNATGNTISEATVGFDGEQWRNGGNVNAQTMSFQYGFGNDFDTVATWVSPGGSFNWASPVTSATAGAVNGNAAGLVDNVGGTLTSLSWASGQTLWFRWVEVNDAGNDHGLAIDNFSLSLGAALPAVTLAVSSNAASEAAASVITVTASVSAALATAQTVQLAVTGSGITAADYALSGSTITIPAGQTSGSVSFTVLDDADPEPNETATLTLVSPSAGIALGSPVSQNIVITDNDSAPTVTLSVSASAGTEAGATAITVTATASSAVVGNQTVALGVTGAGIAASDYYLTGSTITIPAGQTSGSVSFVIADDATAEGTETATLTISAPSAGLALGATTSRNVTITDNAGSFLTKLGGATSVNGAEIAAFDPVNDRVIVVAGPVVEAYQMSASGALTLLGTVAPGFSVPAGFEALPNSVAIKNGVVAVAWAVVDTTTRQQDVGHVGLYDATTGAVLKDLPVGYLPDMLTFTPNGNKVLVANEGEPNSYGQATSFDPVGSVSIIDLSAGAASATVQTAGFGAFDAQINALKASGVRISGPGASVSQDLEPEYITITPDGLSAVVTLQENNAAALVDIATATITGVVPLGTKDFSTPGNGIDASDRDGPTGGGRFNVQNWPVSGMLMPDAIANFTVGGATYFITANEGDARDYTGWVDEIRVGAAALDPVAFPNAATLKANANLGRLTVTRTGDTDGDGDLDVLLAYGGRSFTIWDPVGTRVYDSGDSLEQITYARSPTLFNSDGSAASFDTRSDNKGPEPEGLTTGVVGGRTYAFIGLERTGDIVVYDISTPSAPQFVQYINTPEDVGVEDLRFVSAADSPTGKPLLITANEVSKTVAVFEVKVPVRIADIQGASHTSPLAGQAVQSVPGIVTALASNGFYLQDPQPDADPATSEAIFVFTGSAPAVAVGSAVRVSGTVGEFRAGNNPDNLTTTQIASPTIVPWADAPAGGIAPLVLGVDRVLPTQAINNDFASTGNVETSPGRDFDPATEGIDFFESVEGMLVRIDNPVSVSPTNGFGEIWVLANGGSGATGRTERGGVIVSASDFNPERIQIDNLLGSQVFPTVDVGATLSNVTGVVAYNFNNYEVLALQTPTVLQPSSLQREVTSLAGSADRLTVATFNVENLDPGDGAGKFNALADAVVDNLLSPDIINLEEVQDNNGATNNGVVDANVTLQTLVDAIVTAGGPRYEYRQINPVNNQDGGEPGGNIRVAFLFNPARVSFVENAASTSLKRLVDTDLTDGDAFAASRKPLVGEFLFNGEKITLIGNHFNSKGGDDPLFGPTQPPVLSSEVQRLQQAKIVGDYVATLLAADPDARVIVAGDLNDFEFSAPLTRLESAGLTSLIETLPADQRYTYNFEGNAQALDHIQVSAGLLDGLDGYDVVHVNSEFAVQVSDHDPVVARFTIVAGQVINGTATGNVLSGGAGNDVITGLQGRDRLTGGAGKDQFVYTSVLDAGDVITDFEVGRDLLVIDRLLASVGYTGTDPVNAGYLGVVPGAGRTYVTFDADGAAGAGLPRQLVELTGLVGVTADQLIDVVAV